MAERQPITREEQEVGQVPQVPIRIRPVSSSLARRKEPARPSQSREPSSGSVEIQGVYVISVAARLLEMHPQTLRKYERLGLVRPVRTIGMFRLYSEEDIHQIRLIKHLEDNLGLNLAGVEWALNLLNQLFDMRHRLSMLEEADRVHHMLQQEMNRLFQALNLPLEEPAPEPPRNDS